MIYKSGCWSCRSALSSEYRIRCKNCGWYICLYCGACSPECKHTVRSSQWVKAYQELIDEYVRQKDESEYLARAKQYRIDAEAKAEAEREAALRCDYLVESALNGGVFHSLYGYGSVCGFSEKGENEYIHVLFTDFEKVFCFPDAFDAGYLTLL